MSAQVGILQNAFCKQHDYFANMVVDKSVHCCGRLLFCTFHALLVLHVIFGRQTF